MATNRYSLADYQLVISIPSQVPDIGGTTITIGGPGDFNSGYTNNQYNGFVGKISISRQKDLWSTEGDSTGSWVHTKNLDRTGTCTIDISQISEVIIKLSQICRIFEGIQNSVPGLSLKVKSVADSMPVAVCEDCYISKMPDQNFGDTAEKQSWTFTCGKIDFYIA